MQKGQAIDALAVASPTMPSLSTDGTSPASEITMTDIKIRREHVRKDNSSGFTYHTRRVSVDQAEAGFAELQRELSCISRQHSRVSGHHARMDIEKSGEYSQAESEMFDLEGTLRGNKKDDEESGI